LAKVLIIEDAADYRVAYREMLEGEGYEVIEAKNGVEGLEKLEENGADLIITDIMMPEKGGIETIIDIRKDYPDVKIIAISGAVSPDSETLLRLTNQYKVSRVLGKPIQFRELFETIDELLKSG
jgi:CheY-like chemotaxis protein